MVLAYGVVVTMTATPEADAAKLIWFPTTVTEPRVSEIVDDAQAYGKFIEDFKAAALA